MITDATQGFVDRVVELVPSAQQTRVRQRLEKAIEVLSLSGPLEHNPIASHLALTIIQLVETEVLVAEIRALKQEFTQWQEVGERQKQLLAVLEVKNGFGNKEDVSPVVRTSPWWKICSTVPYIIVFSILFFSVTWVGYNFVQNPGSRAVVVEQKK